MNILVVEDDISVAGTIAETIERWNHNVTVSGTGKDALAKLRQKKFHLALLDIFLPDIKGYELIPSFKAIWPEIGIVTMTGHNTRELEWEVRKQGIIYYMIKPFNMNDMKDILDHLKKKREKGGEETNGGIS